MKKIPQKKIENLLSRIPLWRQMDDKLVRTYEFKDFPTGITFIDRVALVAEEMNHHPDITIRYTKIKFVLTTHSEKMLTENDFILAAKVDEIK